MSAHGSIGAAALPAEHSSFVGRRTQLAAARAALGVTRLLTFLGPGGVGKTRFAIQLAMAVRRLYPEGTWFIDLSGVTGGSVTDEVGRILELHGDSCGGYEAVARFFGARHGMLVLDNCEHVVDECAELVRRLLVDCPEMSIVATSRAALRIAAETVLVVEPLETYESERENRSPAVALFLDRCATVLPDPSAADLEAIAEICRRLEGLPLAIELAATRVKVLAPAQLLERLADPLQYLTGGGRDVPGRHQTLQATIAWSYQLCTEAERAMWRRMSVFVGGWDLESAERMSPASTGGVSALDIVQSLLEKSIITRRRSDRASYFDMLDTVRHFGLEVSSTDELEAARELHRDWYLERLALLEADWYGPRQAHWLALARRELPNIRAALEFSIGRGEGAPAATTLVTAWRVVWQASGRADEFGRWIGRVLDLETPPTPEICQLMTLLGGLEVAKGRADTGLPRLAHAAELAERLGDGSSQALAFDMRASMERDPHKALEGFTRAFDVQGGSNLFPARLNAEEKLALSHDRLGNTEIAGRMREALVARAIRAGDSYETAYLLTGAGSLATRRGEFENATMLIRQALSLTQNLGDPVGVALVEEMLARVAAHSQDYARAATLLGVTHAIEDAAGAIASVYPGTPGVRAEIEQLARRMLGTREFDAAFARGRALTAAEGVAYALGARLPGRSVSRTRVAGESVLTARESQVAGLVGQGLSDKEIADRLVISKRTAEGHVARCLTKLGFTSRTQLAAWTAFEGSESRS